MLMVGERKESQELNNFTFMLTFHVNFVNFHLFFRSSPSVLDRLNALLEPGGVLTIDERGVIDGQIPSIKPHPNFRLDCIYHTHALYLPESCCISCDSSCGFLSLFRLILAMDPRYGEISRAMRNRGVEIFMLGEVC